MISTENIKQLQQMAQTGYVGASSGVMRRHERKRKAFARGTWAGGSI
jgi:hypothetical protein